MSRKRKVPVAPPGRPDPPWHPVPVSELAMLSGAIALLVGVISGRPAVMAVGIGAMALGVFELTLREHLAGYRQHRLILAGATAVAVHFLLVLLLPFRFIGLGALAVDLAVFAAGYWGYDRLWQRAQRRRQAAAAPRRSRRAYS